MSSNKEHFRHMLFYYRKGKIASQTCDKICVGADVVDDSTFRKWLQRFRERNFDVKDASLAGRPITTHLIDGDRHLTTREICKTLNISAITVSRHLRKLGLVKKLNTWVLLHLSDSNLKDCISACDLLLKRNENESFLKQIITR